MRVLVTGAAGFIGSHLVDRLVADGHRVTGVDDLSTGKLANLADARRAKGFSFHRFDITSTDLLTLVARDRPDVVCHLAGQMDVRRSVADPLHDTRTNVLGTVNVLEACVRTGVPRVVFASSGGTVYGEPPSVPVTERAALRPASPYGAAKAAAETYVAAYARLHGLRGVSLRLGNVYGPRQDPHGEAGVVSIFAGALVAGRPTTVFGDGTSSRDYVYVEDVVDAFLRCLGGKGDGRRLNVGSGRATSVRALHALVAKAVGAPDAPEFAPPRSGELQAVALDSSAARRALGWEPAVTLEDGLARTVDWLRATRKR
ncbi:MAG: NAD-dependent epimerase/dehydratase [Frankiales bacterium]|nr:NAD-dependent epimerase/dehydratase [Frankiales bacterium]